jgi:hypothetical protein
LLDHGLAQAEQPGPQIGFDDAGIDLELGSRVGHGQALPRGQPQGVTLERGELSDPLAQELSRNLGAASDQRIVGGWTDLHAGRDRN